MNDKNKARRVQSVNRAAVLVALAALPLLPLQAGAPPKWVLLIEPAFMRPSLSYPIPGAQRTVLVPALCGPDELAYADAETLERLNVDRAGVEELARKNATALLATLSPAYARNAKGVIEYAELRSDDPLVASTVLAPGFIRRFEPVFGPELLIAIPNRFQVFVFPKLASKFRDYAPAVIEAYRATAWPVSLEVFALDSDGLRAVGLFEEP